MTEVVASSVAGTKGFLFCDLRGYTAFIERRGDQAAAELRATTGRSSGRSSRATMGPRSGPRATASTSSSGPPAARSRRPRHRRRGGHRRHPRAADRGRGRDPAGETVATTEGLVGGAVNIAARVCAKAQAGEVLVTDTVRALTRTFLPYRYTSWYPEPQGHRRGHPALPGRGGALSGRARLRRQLGARRGRIVALAALAVVLLVGLVGLYAANRPADCLACPASTKDVVARIDPARNCVVATYRWASGPGPS